jgi:hypothetical protein
MTAYYHLSIVATYCHTGVNWRKITCLLRKCSSSCLQRVLNHGLGPVNFLLDRVIFSYNMYIYIACEHFCSFCAILWPWGYIKLISEHDREWRRVRNCNIQYQRCTRFTLCPFHRLSGVDLLFQWGVELKRDRLVEFKGYSPYDPCYYDQWTISLSSH